MIISSDTIINAISKTLSDNFEGVSIYTNKAEQGLILPCFFITQKNTEFEKVGRNKYKINYLINISYHPKELSEVKLNEIAFNLFNLLEVLSLDNKKIIYSKGLRYEIVDGILQFFVNYELTVNKGVTQETKLNNIEITGGVK